MQNAILRLVAASVVIVTAGIALPAQAQVVAANVMSSISDAADRQKLADITINDNQIVIPPLSNQYLMTVRAYATGKEGGDQSTASLKLYINDGRVAYQADSKFNTYSLETRHTFVTSTTARTRVRFEHVNDRARATSEGLEIVEIKHF